MQIKICGITTAQEIEILNGEPVDYVGFVFFEKSKRNISIADATRLFPLVKAGRQKVGVTVSPDVSLAKQLQQAGIDILQVHGNLSRDVLEAVDIPVWYAFNVTDPAELESKKQMLDALPKALTDKITAIVVDAANYGSGKTFDWQTKMDGDVMQDIFAKRKFILAGGLRTENVQEGMDIFHPDVVDVSSGVEGVSGKKERPLIHEFVRKVREHE